MSILIFDYHLLVIRLVSLMILFLLNLMKLYFRALFVLKSNSVAKAGLAGNMQ